MKNRKLIITILILFVLTGCVKYDLKMKVGTDKSFTLTIIDAIQSEYYTAEDDKESIANYETLGYEVEEYKDSTHTGLSLKKEFKNIDLISSANCGTIELTELLTTNTSEIVLFKSQKVGTTTTYTADFTYDLTVEESVDTTTEEVDYSEFASSMYFGYSITLPTNSTVLSSNADKVSNNGYTLTWNMEYGNLENIDFVFSIDDKSVTKEDISSDDNNTIVDENDNNKEQTTPKEEQIETDTTIKEEKNTSKSTSILTTLIAIAIILGLIVLKIKINSKSKPKTKSDPTSLHHNMPPNNK